MKSVSPLILCAFLFICSCSNNMQQPPSVYHPDTATAVGYIIPDDSLEQPTVVPAGDPKIVTAGKPNVVLTKNNVQKVGQQKMVPAGDPAMSVPGRNGLALPDTVPAISRPVLAGSPEIVTAREAGTRDKNSQNFTYYGRLQGMKTNDFLCMQEDDDGNLWFGSNGSGITKFDGTTFAHYSEREGLTQNFVLSMLKDKKDNLWFATQVRGLGRFDGKYFTNYTEEEGLSNDWVTSLLEDNEGNIWIGTLKGLNKFDGKNFIRFTTKQGLPSDSVWGMSKDRNGNIWLATENGISKYDGTAFHSFSSATGKTDRIVLRIHPASNGQVWFGHETGLSKYDGKYFTHYTQGGSSSPVAVSEIHEDKNGNIWVGFFGGGVVKFDGDTFVYYGENEGLGSSDPRDIYEDKSGNLWIVTNGGGVNKFGGNSFAHFTDKEGLMSRVVFGFLENPNGVIWMNTDKGLTKYDSKSFTNYSTTEGIVNGFAWCMTNDTKGRLWLGTLAGLSIFDGVKFTNFTVNEGLLNNDIKCLLEDKKGNMWIGSSSGLTKYDGKTFTHFTEKSGLGSNILLLLSLMEDTEGNIWIGTGGGVKKYDGKTFTHYTLKESAGYNVVLSIVQDQKGHIWFGTSAGVVRYDGKHFWRFNEKEGLANNEVLCIIQDDKNLWIGAENGLTKIRKSSLASFEKSDKVDYSVLASRLCKTYNYEDGLSGFGVNLGKSIYKDKSGTIWIGSNNMMTVFNPEAIKEDTTPPVVRLTGIALFNERMSWQKLAAEDKMKDTVIEMDNGVNIHDVMFSEINKWYGIPQDLSLAHDNNYITFQFAGITMQSPKRIRYQYMLDGLDRQWSAPTNRTEVPYSNLPHGKYTFKVRAMNVDGYWSNELHYSFAIRPPWWLTWWAYAFYALVFGGVIYSAFRYRIMQLRKQHEIKHQTSALEMKALRAQMNPHFIFNSLNSINLFIMENNRLQASEYLAIFSRLVRLILNNSREAFIPLAQELEALQLYLELESLRFEHRFNYTISVDSEIDSTTVKVPPLVIQPYVENAIWHGLMHKKESGKLDISLYMADGVLNCKITDDGIGRVKAAEFKSKFTSTGKSMGMRITSDRIALLQDKRDGNDYLFIKDLVLPDGSAAGTEVLLKIPVNYD